MMYRYLLVISVFTMFVFAARAQTIDAAGAKKTDTLNKIKHPVKTPSGSFAPKINPATEKIYHPDSTHSPHKAVMRSLLIPGLGQIYNHRWWKVPFIYAGLGLLGRAIITNGHDYNEYLILSRYRAGNPPQKGDPYYNEYYLYINVPTDNISDARENSRRNRDISIMSIVAVWGVQAIDAYIDAKFMNAYTVDNNLGFKVTPTLMNQPVYAENTKGSYIPGLKFTFTF